MATQAVAGNHCPQSLVHKLTEGLQDHDDGEEDEEHEADGFELQVVSARPRHRHLVDVDLQREDDDHEDPVHQEVSEGRLQVEPTCETELCREVKAKGSRKKTFCLSNVLLILEALESTHLVPEFDQSH